MSMHYSFYNGTITAHTHWESFTKEPRGSYFYSPKDDEWNKWGRVTPMEGLGWVATSKEDMPKEFLVQLLLMGVPC